MRPPLSRLDGYQFDVFVIGGGINGASAAQHLSAAGYSVGLAEKNDYASAASSRSTRILHSGLRYLAPKHSLWEFVRQPDRFRGQIRSAKESMEAMGQLVSTAPERVSPLPLWVPVFDDAPYAGWQIDLGVKFLQRFDRYGVPLVYQRHKGTDRSRPIFKWFRDSGRIRHFVMFQDYNFQWPERLCVDAALDSERMGAVVRNYTEVLGFERTPDQSWRIRLKDRVDGTEAVAVASVIINTGGVWIDDINRLASTAAGCAGPSRKIIGIKGVHIVARLPDDFYGEGVAAMNRENENIFCVPWGDLHYIGPTETVYEGTIEDVRPGEEDIRFLIAEVNHLFPALKLERKDIVFAWAGVRPITFDPEQPKGRRLPFSVLHDLAPEGLPDMFTLTWGSINLHRVAGSMITRAVGERIRPSGTPQTINYAARLFPATTDTQIISSRHPSYRLADLRYSATNEHAVTLIDLLFRRTPIGWGPGMTRTEVWRAAQAAAAVLQWDRKRTDSEIDEFIEYAARYHLQTIA